MRPIALLAGPIALLCAAAPAAAASRPTFDVPDPCVAGACQVDLTYVAAPGGVAKVEVDWEHPGAAADGFAPDQTLTCAAPGTVDLLGPPLPVLPTTCTATSPTLATPGATRVAVRITIADGPALLVSQAVRVVEEQVAAPAPDPEPAADACPPSRGGEQCGPGGGRRTAGGGEKVSHKGWPSITGILWKVLSGGHHAATGGEANDELLGHHGDDTIRGGDGRDVIWGDWDPSGQPTSQVDRLDGEGGADWIYSSHGRNAIRGGAGKDYIWAYYGHGTIDCGPGFDTLRIKLQNGFTTRNCERIKNFCSFGSKPGNQGGCYKPGEKPKRRELG